MHTCHFTVPVTFVDYYRADYAAVLPATSASDYQFYYVFLRENLFDDSSPLDVSLVHIGHLSATYSSLLAMVLLLPGH